MSPCPNGSWKVAGDELGSPDGILGCSAPVRRGEAQPRSSGTRTALLPWMCTPSPVAGEWLAGPENLPS